MNKETSREIQERAITIAEKISAVLEGYPMQEAVLACAYLAAHGIRQSKAANKQKALQHLIDMMTHIVEEKEMMNGPG